MSTRATVESRGLVREPDGRLWFRDAPPTYLDAFAVHVEADGEAVAIVDADDREVTYAELWDRAGHIAGGITRAGARPGDRIAIDLGNSIEWVVAFLGAVMAGCVAVPIDQRANETTRSAVLQDCHPALVIDSRHVTPTGHWRVTESHPDDFAQLLYTSGTTGTPKGVIASQRNLASYGHIVQRALNLDPALPRIRNLVAVALCHAAGCNAQLLPTLTLGGTVILAKSTAATDIVSAARRHSADSMLCVPAVYKLMAQREPAALRRLTTLRRLIYGAAPMSPALIAELRELMPHVELANAYGMTEISSIALYLPPHLALSHHASVGFPVPGVEVQLRDVDGEGKGELLLRGPNMAQGYWNKPELTDEVFGTGWVRSGDLAVIDADGLVYIRGRLKDVINRGGEKVYSVDVENALLSHPAVLDVTVLPFADPVMGEKVGAVVVAAGSVTDQELRSHVANHLPTYCVPERIVLRSQPLPRGNSGKVAKADLRAALGW